MDNQTTTPRRLAAGLLVTTLSLATALWQPVLLAADQDAHQHEHAKAVQYSSAGAAWAALQESVKTIEEATAQKNLKPVHAAEEKTTGALKYLEGNSSMVTEEKATRLKSALSQAIKIADSLHHASDAGDQIRTESELKKLQGALKLVQAQYPAETLETK